MTEDLNKIKAQIDQRIELNSQKNSSKAILSQKLKDYIFSDISNEEFVSIYLHNDDIKIDQKLRQIFWEHVIFNIKVKLKAE